MKHPRSIFAAALALALSTGIALAQSGQGSSPLTGPKGGTNNGFMQFTGPASSLKTYTLPNASDTIATLGAIQTFTAAKTFASAKLLLAGSTSGAGTLNAPAIASTYVWTLPAATDTLVGRATTDTLTNKTFDTAGTGNSLSINGLAATANTGTGSVVRATSPVLVTPNLGTPSAGVLTNVTGLPVSTGISGLGTGVATALAVPSSANVAAAVTDETGSGALVFGTAPTISAPVITGSAAVQQAIALSGDISPTQITSNINDYAPTGFSTAATLRISTDASRNITGLAGGADGKIIIIHNVGSFNAVLTNQDAASTGANRFLLGGDMTLVADTSVTLRYDATSSRWRAITSPGAGGGGGGVTSVTVGAGEGVALTGTCTITTSGTCTVARSDSVRQNEALIWIYQSKLLGDIRRGVNLFATGFKAATDALRGINAGSSSNYDTTNAAASGYVAPTTTSGTVTTSGGNPPAQVASAGFLAVGPTYFNETTAIPNGVTIASVGVYSDAAGSFVMKIVKKNSSTSVDVVVSQSFSHPGGGWADLTLSSPYTVPGTGSYYPGAAFITDPSLKYNSGQTFLKATTNITGNGQTVTEQSGNVPSFRATQVGTTNNMTLVTTSQTADASVSNGRALIEFDNTATPALNTDLTVEVTCNGGTNWAAATLSLVAANGQGGRSVAETADTACTSGTSFAVRVKTLNNKAVPIYGVNLRVH